MPPGANDHLSFFQAVEDLQLETLVLQICSEMAASLPASAMLLPWAHAVWQYFRFSLPLVEEMLLERGIVVSYETIHRWGRGFRPHYGRRLRRKPPRPSDVWHLDEVVISIAGKKHWLWRAVDQDGYVRSEIVQNRRKTKATKRLLIRLMKNRAGHPSV